MPGVNHALFFKLISMFFFLSIELSAIDSSNLNWKKCSRKSAEKRENNCSKRSSSSLVDDLLRRNKFKNNKNPSSKLKNEFTCPCQKLQNSMDFGVSW